MKRFFSGIFFIVLFIQAGCVKEGDVFSSVISSAKDLITDEKSAQYALNGLYSKFANSISDPQGHLVVAWDVVHETPPAMMAGLAIDIDDLDFLTNKPSSGNPVVIGMWGNDYDIVNAANSFIDVIGNLPDYKFTAESKNEMLGEARFLRAYANYQLLIYFGEFYDINSTYGVMLRKGMINAGNVSLKRSTVADAYTYILEDINFAITNAPLTNPDYYANQWVAKALKARILINRGIGDDYMQTISLTADIINNGPYSLEMNLKDLFYTKGLDSKEVMLGIVPQPQQDEKTINYVDYFSANTPFINLMGGDPRSSWELKPDTIFPELLIYINKYGGNYPEVSYVFRLTEMYLLRAEAIARNNGDLSAAKALLKTVMEHAGITDFTPVDQAATAIQLETLIYQEISKNLFCEDGAEWFGLLRMGFDYVKINHPTIKSKTQYILPIPADELRKNKDMIQNPGY